MGRESLKECLVFFWWTKEAAFLYKIFIRGIRNSRNFHPSRSERLACFETQPSSEVFEEFSGTFCTLYLRTLRF